MSKLVFLNRLIFILGILGFVIAGYVLQGYLRSSSVYCPAGGGCDLVRKSPYAWPLGIPVPAVGFMGYSIIIILSFLRTIMPKKDKQLLYGLFGMATFGALFVTGFTFTQLFLIKATCFWCIVSTIDMYVIFHLVLFSLRKAKP
jgi:uncharacterized membrane protein